MKPRMLTYLGPFDAVEVPVLDEQGRRTLIVAERDGDAVEVPGKLAAGLLESGAWAEPSSSSRKRTASSSSSTPTDKENSA